MSRIQRLLVLLFLCCALRGFAVDFGLLIGQSIEYGKISGGDPDPALNYTGTYSPWLVADLGSTAWLYLSAKLSMKNEDGAWKPEDVPLLPELGRFEFSWRPKPNVYLQAGRVRFQDASELIAANLFDGINSSIAVGPAHINAGVFYTGLQYKETAKIIMSSADMTRYAQPMDYADFSNSYFASRRVVLSVGADFPDLSYHTNLALSGLAQFDVNDVSAGALLHSQYLSAHFTMSPLDTLELVAAGVAELMENPEAEPHVGFAASLGAGWDVPGTLPDMLQGEFRFSNGTANDIIGAFTPLSASPQGQVFTPRLSGLLALKGKYTARFHPRFSGAAEGTYFIRTDGETVNGTGFPASDRRLVGGELYGMCMWAPLTDFMVTVGGGAFFPRLGDVFTADAPIRWKVLAGFILSL